MVGTVNFHIFLSPCTHESRFLKEAQTLLNAGLFEQVEVAGLHDDGLNQQEALAPNIIATRIKLYSRNLSRGMVAQGLKYMEWAWRVLRRAKKCDVGVLHAHSIAALPVGVLAKWLTGAPLVYDAHEFETERTGMAGLRKKLACKVERFCVRYADKVMVVSESIAQGYEALYGEKPALVLNAPRKQTVQAQDKFRESLGIRPNQIIFLYQGALSQGRGLDALLKVFAARPDDKGVLVCMGYGSLEATVKGAAAASPHIFYHDAVSPNVLLEYTASADVGICYIQDSSLSYRYCMPNKLFEYIMAGLPVMISDLPEMKRVVDAHRIGVTVKGDSTQDFARAVEVLLSSDLASYANGTANARDTYNWEAQEAVLLELYRDLLGA